MGKGVASRLHLSKQTEAGYRVQRRSTAGSNLIKKIENPEEGLKACRKVNTKADFKCETPALAQEDLFSSLFSIPQDSPQRSLQWIWVGFVLSSHAV